MSVIGFDLGNKTSLVAVARGSISVLQNSVGSRTTPTVVGFNEQRLTGGSAVSQMNSNPKNTITNLKRLIGRSYDDPELKIELDFLPYEICGLEDGSVGIKITYNGKKEILRPEQVLACFFSDLKATGVKGLGKPIKECVISCPSYWGEKEKSSLLDSAKLADLEVLSLMNETTAVALSYGMLGKVKGKTVLFCDIGDAHTSCSVVKFTENKLEVLANNSERNVGGRNFDMVLVNHFAQYIKDKYKLDVLSNAKAKLKLLKECIRCKKILSANNSVKMAVEYIMNSVDVKGEISREEFEKVSEPLIAKIVNCIVETVAKAKIPFDKIDAIEVVGGGSRVPAVEKAIVNLYGKQINRTCDASESVAKGCALQCAMLSTSFHVSVEYTIQDVVSHPISVAWGPPSGEKEPELVGSADVFKGDTKMLKSISIVFPDNVLSAANYEPFQLLASYSNVEDLPKGTHPMLSRNVITPLKKDQLQINSTKREIKVKMSVNKHGLFQVDSADFAETIEVVDAPKKKDEPKKDAKKDAKKDTKKETKKEEPKKDEKPKKKKKKIKTPLKIQVFRTSGLEEKVMEQLKDAEHKMRENDRHIAETEERRNDLESYVLDMRGKAEGDLKQYFSEAACEQYLSDLLDAEDWLDMEEDLTKEDFVKKLLELKKVGDAAVSRAFEKAHRNEYVNKLKSTIVTYQLQSQSQDEKHAHITKEELQSVQVKCVQSDSWLEEKLNQQDKLHDYDNPAVTCSELMKHTQALEKFCKKVMEKPIPKKEEPKKEEPKKEEAKKDDTKMDVEEGAGKV